LGEAPYFWGFSHFNELYENALWWTRSQRIRTLGEMLFDVPLIDTVDRPLYQKIAEEATHLQRLGLNYAQIARHLKVDDKTVAKALHWINK
jgi:hypothetical protein